MHSNSIYFFHKFHLFCFIQNGDSGINNGKLITWKMCLTSLDIIHTHTQYLAHNNTHIHTRTLTHTDIYTHRQIDTYIHTDRHTHTHIHKHIHTHTNKYTRTDRHTYTHTMPLGPWEGRYWVSDWYRILPRLISRKLNEAYHMLSHLTLILFGWCCSL